MKTRRARLQFKCQSGAPAVVVVCVLLGDTMLAADNLKALNNGKVMRRLGRRRQRVFLPVARPCFDHHQVPDRRPTATASKSNSLLALADPTPVSPGG